VGGHTGELLGLYGRREPTAKYIVPSMKFFFNLFKK